MADKTTLSARVPVDTNERVEDLADDLDAKKSDVLRRAVLEYLDDKENGSRARERSVSPLALVGVVALAIAPTLLATGYTGLGLASGAVAAIYVLLWLTAYDVLVEDALGAAREELVKAGGVVGFFRTIFEEDRLVDDPQTPVERLTRADVIGFAVLSAGVVLVVPIAAAKYLGYLAPAVETIGAAGALAVLGGIVVVTYVGFALLGLSALATVALATAGILGRRVEDAADA